MSYSSYPVNKVLISGKSIASTFTSATVPKEGFSGYYVEAAVTGGSSPTGTFKLQSSAQGTNWADVADSSTSITDNGIYVWNVDAARYFYWRLVYTAASGTGTLTITYNMS